MSAKNSPTRKRDTIVGYLTMLLIVVSIGWLIWPKKADTPAPRPTPTKNLSSIQFAHIRDKHDTSTAVQWSDYRDKLAGVRVQWSGWVAEVKASGEVWVDMDSPDAFSIQDVYFRIPQEDARKYNKGQKITFTGEIDVVTDVLGRVAVHLKDVTIQ